MTTLVSISPSSAASFCCTSNPPRTERTSNLRLLVRPGRAQHAHEAEIFLFLQKARASVANSGAMMTSLKISLIAFATAQIERPIANDDAAERRLLVGRESLSPGFAQVGIAPHTTRIGVLQNRDGRLGKFVDQVGRGGDVEEVVKGKFLAVQFLKMLGERFRRSRRSDADFRRSAAGSTSGKESEKEVSVSFFSFRKVAIARS